MKNEEKLNEMLNEIELDNQVELIKDDEGDGDDGTCTERVCLPKTN